MNLIARIILPALVLTFCATVVSAKEKIDLALDASGNRLTISCDIVTDLGSVFNRKIEWVITDALIDSFQVVGKTPGDPFTERPGKKHGKSLELKAGIFKWVDWRYTIVWFANGSSTPHECDPVIAVRPTTTFMLTLVALITLMVGMKLYQKKILRKRKKE